MATCVGGLPHIAPYQEHLFRTSLSGPMKVGLDPGAMKLTHLNSCTQPHLWTISQTYPLSELVGIIRMPIV